MATATPVNPADSFKRAARRLERLGRLGCAPVLVILTLLLLISINLVSYIGSVPLYAGSNGLNDFIASRLLVDLYLIFLIQLAIDWVVGMVAAVAGTRAAAGQGKLAQHRLLILQGRLGFLAWPVFAVRLLGLAIVAFAALWMFTPLFGRPLAVGWAANINFAARYQTLAFALFLIVCLAAWIFGPFLRVRYSMALGTLAGSWSRRSDERFWLALSARLGTEMLGIILTVWAATMANVIYYAGRGSGDSYQPYSPPIDFASLWPAYQGIWIYLGTAAALSLIMAGQVLLPRLYLWLAAYRLARQPVDQAPSFAKRLASRGLPLSVRADSVPDVSAPSS